MDFSLFIMCLFTTVISPCQKVSNFFTTLLVAFLFKWYHARVLSESLCEYNGYTIRVRPQIQNLKLHLSGYISMSL